MAYRKEGQVYIAADFNYLLSNYCDYFNRNRWEGLKDLNGQSVKCQEILASDDLPEAFEAFDRHGNAYDRDSFGGNEYAYCVKMQKKRFHDHFDYENKCFIGSKRLDE